MKTLVVYFSRKGYVKRVAESIAKERGADVFELKTTERTEGILGFWWCGRFGMHRWGMKLTPVSVDVSEYDNVVFCSPIWVFSVCAPMREFLGLCSGKVKSAEYVFVHFSSPMGYSKTADAIDSILGVKRKAYTSICCMLGKVFRTKRFETTQITAA